MTLFPFVSFDAIALQEANAYLSAWAHRMGPINRPCHDTFAHALCHEGVPVAVVTTSGLIREWVGGGLAAITRDNAIELSRLCAARRDLNRVVLRLWREFVFPTVGKPIAISYQDAALHTGDLYRFDGWTRLAMSRGGGVDRRSGRPGRDRWVWGWPPDRCARLIEDDRGGQAPCQILWLGAADVSRATLYCGHVLDVLARLSNGSARCCVTSPPYWGLRDYGVAGQLGLEPTPEEYVANMVAVFRGVRRVLADDGTLWLNMGDCYATSPKGHDGFGTSTLSKQALVAKRGALAEHFRARARVGRSRDKGNGASDLAAAPHRAVQPLLKRKDLVGLPWRLAFALQADGWYLRSDIIWAKPNPMPESVTDRPTKAHEYVFLLALRERYYYDAKAIRTPARSSTSKMPDGWDSGPGGHGSFHRNGREKGARTDKQRGHGRRHDGFNDRWDQMEREQQVAGGANARSVWTIATRPYPKAHFATFPEELAQRCILAGSAPGDTVLDPFGGSGTTAAVAVGHGRSAIYVDLNPAYLALARERIGSMLCDEDGAA